LSPGRALRLRPGDRIERGSRLRLLSPAARDAGGDSIGILATGRVFCSEPAEAAERLA
jgi:hypothetical protein